MQFNSYSYLLLLAPVVTIFWLLNPPLRRAYILLLSVLFYASWSLRYVPLPFVLCTAAFICARGIQGDPTRARRWLWRGVLFTLAILAFFKYGRFLQHNVDVILQVFGKSPSNSMVAIGLPVGISFYSFELIGFLIDTKQGRAKRISFTQLATFVTFWPNLISGPIARVRELIPQFTFQKQFEMAMLIRGLDRLVLGLVQKNLIANNLRAFVDEGFLPQAAQLNTTIDNWFLAFAFGLQVYFDFASYSNMAIGTAHLIGVTLPENFNFPYHAANPSDFWSRWHMTLSRWIRDYLFFPINARFKAAPGPLYASLIGIMALVGLWHGAGWGFVLWGVMHGIYLVLFRIWENFREHRFPSLGKSRAVALAWKVFTLFAVMAAWIAFRASGVTQALKMLRTMTVSYSFHVSYSINLYLITLMVAGVAALEPYLYRHFRAWERNMATYAGWQTANYLVLRPLLYAIGLLLFLAFDDRNTQFIYFQF